MCSYWQNSYDTGVKFEYYLLIPSKNDSILTLIIRNTRRCRLVKVKFKILISAMQCTYEGEVP